MPHEAPESLEALKKKLYERESRLPSSAHERSSLRAHMRKENGGWGEDDSVVPRTTRSFATKLFLGSLIFFSVSALIALIVFLSGGNVVSSENVGISISAPVSVAAGSEVTYQIVISNNNNVPLEETGLTVTYPDGTRVVGDIERELKRFRASLGDISAHAEAEETLQAVFFGQEGTQKNIHVELEYRVPGSNAVFVAQKDYVLAISSSPITVTASLPAEFSAGQEFSMDVNVHSNSTSIVRGIVLHIEYPFGFTFASASPQPISSNTTWSIGDLQPGGERTITVRGKIVGQDGEEKAFRIEAGAASADRADSVGVIYSSLLSVIEIVRPFISLQVSADGLTKDTYAIARQSPVRVKLAWTNNLQTRVSNAVIEVRLSGNALDKNTVEVADGFFRSVDNTIIFDRTTLGALASIEPGSTGEVSFVFASLPLFAGSTSLKNPLIDAAISVRGERTSQQGASEEIENTLARSFSVISDVGFTGRSVYYVGPFVNTGPLPPRAEEETTYTIIWTAVNSSNVVSDARVTATLPSYVDFTGAISPATADIIYDDRSRTVTWRIGTLEAGVGAGKPAREAAFQISFTPSVSHRTKVIDLISDSRLTGFDEFARVPIDRAGRPLTTDLSTDPQFNSANARVAE